MPGIGSCFIGRHDGLHGGAAVDVGEAHLLHRVQVVEVAPEFLEPVGRWQGIGMVAEVVLAELAGVVAEIQQELGDRWRAGSQIRDRLPGNCGGIMPVRSGCMPVKKALRPAVQLCSA